MNRQSVLAGGLALLFSRFAGMGLGFLAFLLVAWRSQVDLGIFRTVLTYMAIADLLPMLGVHTWLAATLGGRDGLIRRHLAAGAALALTVSAALGGGLFWVAEGGVYDAEISRGLHLVLWVLPASAILLNNNAILVGMGHNDQFAKLVAVENLLRLLACAALIAMGGSVLAILAAYVAIRWSIVAYSTLIVTERTISEPWSFDLALFREFVRQVPVFAVIMVAAIATRHAGALLVPALHGAQEAGVIAASYQLFDLTLVLSTVFCTSLNHAFALRAKSSLAWLMRDARSAILVISGYILPVAAIGIALAEPVLITVYNADYAAAALPLRLLLVTAVLISIDQVVALVVVAAKHPAIDMKAGVSGAMATILLAHPLIHAHALAGPAIVLGVTTIITLGMRLLLLRRQMRVRLRVCLLLWRPALVSILTGLGVWISASWLRGQGVPEWGVMLIGGAMGGLLVLSGYYSAGVFRPAIRRRVRGLLLARQMRVA